MGGMRTALYDYLFAKKNGGDFVLRIEDTDTARFVPGAEQYIEEALAWAGIEPDESPTKGGPFGPYRQSERRSLYAGYTEKILKTDYAYLAFDTPEELEAIREEFEKNGEVFAYNYFTRQRLRNSISLPPEEVQALLAAGTPHVVRFKMPFDRILALKDLIRGEFSVNTNTLDDKVLVKNDGMPTYHFANIIDDHEMEITHVIRGEEWLPSLGLHILLYEAFGWEAPQFAHLSLILKPEGKGKLSKRDGAKFGFPVFPLDFRDPETGEVSAGYRESGYLPDAFINFLALLGWSPAEDKEILSLEEMVNEFDLNKVHKAGARFSKEKAEWFNHVYLQKLGDEDLAEIILASPFAKDNIYDHARLLRIIPFMKERANFPQDVVQQGKFFFEAPHSFDEKAVAKAWKPETSAIMEKLSEYLSAQEDFSVEASLLTKFAETEGLGAGKIMMPMRLALVGELKGPDVPVIMEILGKEETLKRMAYAVETLGKAR